MLLKLLLILLIIYLVVRTVGNLAHAVLGDGRSAQRHVEPPRAGPSANGASSSESTGQSRDIEDAKWVDL